MNPQLVIPMGPTGSAPVQTIDVTPVGTGQLTSAQTVNTLGVAVIGLYLIYLYHRRHHGGAF